MARPKKEQVTNINQDEVIKGEELRKILTPFAEWAWGNKEVAQLVIDKYFKQNPDKA